MPDTPTAGAPADTDLLSREPSDYVEAWLRLTLDSPDTKAAAFVAMHVSRLVQELAEVRAQVEAARQDTLNRAADAIQAMHPGEVKNSVLFLRDLAARGETRQP